MPPFFVTAYHMIRYRAIREGEAPAEPWKQGISVGQSLALPQDRW